MSSFFKGFSNINRPNISENIRDNVITFIDWGMLNAGGFYNVNIPASGAYGGDPSRLRPVSDPRYTNGRVWQGFRNNWVWESGIATVIQPVAISGLYINNTFYPNGSGYYIDYPGGRVIFDNAVPAASAVKLAYSFKQVNVTDANRVPLFRRIQLDSYRVDYAEFTTGSGLAGLLAEGKIQLPAIAVETPIRTNSRPYELGNGSQIIETDVVLHILAEDDSTASRLADALIKQKEKTIFMYDPHEVGLSGKFPLDYRGVLVNRTMTYDNLIKTNEDGGYRYTSGVNAGKMRIADAYVSGNEWINQKVYHKPVRWTVETIVIII